MPRIRAQPEDFRVCELPLYEPAKTGEHTFVWVEKRLRTTEAVARQLAAAAGVANREVGFAGRKDRQAVARQWFSLPRLAPERCLELELEGARVLRAERHPHKLRTGQLSGNRFEVVVRELEAEQASRVEGRLEELGRRGFPNRFGRQRFGRDGNNADRGAELLRGDRRLRDRRTARFLVSALQSAIFNRALAARALPVDAVRIGDVAEVHASGGLFLVEEPAAEEERLVRFEISPTGPIVGPKMKWPVGTTLDEERGAMAALGVAMEDLELLRRFGLRGGRRALRSRPAGVACERLGDSALRLAFTLDAGAFATVFLAELLPGVELIEGAAAGALDGRGTLGAPDRRGPAVQGSSRAPSDLVAGSGAGSRAPDTDAIS